MEYKEFSAKTVDDAITAACQEFTVVSSKLDYEVVEEGSSGFLGIGSKPAVIRARVKDESTIDAENKSADAKDFEAKNSAVKSEVKDTTARYAEAKFGAAKPVTAKPATVKTEGPLEDVAKDFLKSVFTAMNMAVVVDVKYDAAEKNMDIELSGEEMGVLIGKRGQTLDSLQYLVSLVVNKDEDDYIRVKVDTENYRQRRKETLENLAKNISYKVKRTKRSVSLEPMNPYERRIIHSALQNDKYVTTHSEGEEPFRRVVVSLKK
ncbi:MAG: protein jag [Lachnospiraceae bacterium]|nr:protein jag [Lachnospiraceae bacterium]